MDCPLDEIVSEQMMARIREADQTEEDAPAAKPVMPTGAILVIDMLHDDGKHYMHTIRPDDTTSWQAVGMATVAARHWADQGWDD